MAVNWIAIYCFFSIILLSFILLSFAYCYAKRLLNKSAPQRDDEEEETGEETEDEIYLASKSGLSGKLLAKAAAFQIVSEKNVLGNISNEGFKHIFASEAVLEVSLQYMPKQKLIQGNIRFISGLKALAKDAPESICFHIKLMPKKRFSHKTKWKPTDSKLLAITFTLGPVEKSSLSNGTLCMRLYGKGKFNTSKLSNFRTKCYGECFLKLHRITETTKTVEYKQRILPKGQYNDSQLIFTETEASSGTESDAKKLSPSEEESK